MKHDKPIRVRHPRYGRGYVYIIGEDVFGVAFLWGLKRVQFPLSAMKDDTLTMTAAARAMLLQQYESFMEWVRKEKSKRENTAQEG